MKQCKNCEYESAAFMPCNACNDGSEFKPKKEEKVAFTYTLKEFDHKLLFIDTATALVKSVSQSIKINNALYDFGIDVANYVDPAYEFLEDFISNNYDDKYGNILDCLFAIAEYGSADVGTKEFKEIKTVEELYNFYFGGKE